MSEPMVNVYRAGRKWVIGCQVCEGVGFRFNTVATTVAWADAYWWARWHVREHLDKACPHCGDMKSIPMLAPLDPNMVRIGARYFTRDGSDWCEVEMSRSLTGAAHE